MKKAAILFVVSLLTGCAGMSGSVGVSVPFGYYPSVPQPVYYVPVVPGHPHYCEIYNCGRYPVRPNGDPYRNHRHLMRP